MLTRELGRLAKWLRILGIDTEYSLQRNNASVVVKALQEDRQILTRNHRFPASRGIKIAVLKEEQIDRQIAEAVKLLGVTVKTEALFTRCTVCNLPLVDIVKDQVKAKVPEYVFQTQEKFLSCSGCRRIYWQGTHWKNAEEALRSIKG